MRGQLKKKNLFACFPFSAAYSLVLQSQSEKTEMKGGGGKSGRRKGQGRKGKGANMFLIIQ